MKGRRSLPLLCVVAFGFVLGSLAAHAATPGFTISAANVTMPSSGNGSIPFVLSSVDGYAGQVVVSCPGVDAPAGAKIPICGGGPVVAFDLTANEKFSGNLILTPYGVPVPVAAGALVFAFAFWRRRRVAWPTRAMVLACALAGLGEVAGCGSGNSGMTPGTYAYTITAADTKTNVVVSTTATVTVR